MADTVSSPDINHQHWTEDSLNAFFCKTPSLFCIADLDGYFRRINPEFSKVLGYSEGHLLAHPFMDFVHPDDRASTQQELSKLASGDTSILFENRYRCASGSYRTFVWNAIANPVSGLIYAAAVDVTAQKLAESSLRQERDFSRAVIDTVGALVVVLDRQGTIVRFNRTCEQITGYAAAEVLGQSMWERLLPPEELASAQHVFQQLLQHQRPCRHENYWLSKAGQRYLVVWSNTVLTDSSGQVNYVIATGIDVTEHRQDQQHIQQQQRQNQLLADMTRRIQQSLDLRHILQTTVTEVQTLLGCDRVFVLQDQPDGSAQLVAQRVSHPRYATLASTFPTSYIHLYRSTDGIVSQQINTSIGDNHVPDVVQSLTVSAQIVVPLVKQNQFWGLLVAHYCTTSHRWSPFEIGLMEQLADQLSVAIDQAELLGNLETAVAQRTADLTQANNLLQQEISERQQTEAALRESQQTLAGILNLAGEAILSVDEQQRICVFNQAAARIFGHEPAAVVGRSLEQLLPGAFSLLQANSESSNTSQPSWRIRVAGVRQSGERFPAEASISKNMTGQGPLYTVMLQDVTDRVQAESAIRRSEAQLRTTTNALPVLIAYIDQERRYRFNNWAYEEWLGIDYTSLEGQPVETVLGQEIYHTIRPYLDQALTGQSVRFEAQFAALGEPYQWVSVSYKPDIQSGQVKGCFALTQDISDRKATEKIKDEFVSVVSHELRTPLTSIHGALKLLSTGQLGQLERSGHDLLQIALNNTERLTRLINDVLDLERIESGQVKMQQVACEVTALMAQATRAMMPMAQSYGITLKSIPIDTQVCADPDHIEQTLTNLLSNAIKFSPTGDTVVIEAQERPQHIVFKVIDRGRGIPEDKLETIFERFQQVDGSDSRKHGGTGLGLAICREIIQRHGGRIWVKSVHGQGSSFCFTLPKLRPISRPSKP